MKRSRAAIGTAVLTSAVTSLAMLAVAPAATAAPSSDPIATGLVGPLQFDVEDTGGKLPRVVVAQSFAGKLTEIRPNGKKKLLHQEQKSEVSGVSINGVQTAFLTTRFSQKKPAAFLKLHTGDGPVGAIANLFKYEQEVNPDGDTRYGFQGLSKACKSKLPKAPGIKPYNGIIESHPYGLADAPEGGWYVADAAGNTILEVTPEGGVSTVAVLPPQNHTVTKKEAEASEMPKCVAGKTFAFEAVPTDVEVADDGTLVVSLLPGGPEDPSLGARGSVVRIDTETDTVTPLATGLAAATNVALDGDRVFVTEMFGGKISEIAGDGTVTTYAERKLPAAVEFANGQLFAAIDVFNQKKGGKIIAFAPEHAE